MSTYRFYISPRGPVLIAKWPRVSPLAACGLSPLAGFVSCREHVRKLPVTFGLDGGFHWALLFSPPLV